MTNLLFRMGVAYQNLGDISKALDYFIQASNSVVNLNLYESSFQVIQISHQIANIYFEQGNYWLALNYYYKALAYKNSTTADYGSEMILSRIANCYDHLGKPKMAAQFFIKAIDYLTELQNARSVDFAGTYNMYSEFLMKTGEVDAAKSWLIKGRQVLQATGQKQIYETYYENIYLLASVYYKQNEFKKSLKLLQEGIKNNRLSNLPNNELSAENLYYTPQQMINYSLMAEIYFTLYRSTKNNVYLDSAGMATKTCLGLLSSFGNLYSSQENQLHIASKLQAVFPTAINIALEHYELSGNKSYLEEAFRITEQSKSFALTFRVKDRNAVAQSNIPDSLKQREASIRAKIAFYQDRIYQERQSAIPDEEKIKRWQGEMFVYKQQQDSIYKKYENDYPQYFKLKYSDPVISLKAVKSKISPDQVLIEYKILHNSLLIFLATKDELSYEKVPLPFSLDSLVTAYLELLSTNPITENFNTYFNRFTALSGLLYNTLHLPVQENTVGKELLIIPDEVLAYVPFETLVPLDENQPVRDFRKLHYLLKDHEINYSYSATLYFREIIENKIKKNRVLAFAPVYRNYNQGESKNHHVLRGEPLVLRPLIHSEDEIKGISKYFKSSVFIYTDATERHFKSQAGQFDILHLSMHTLYNDNNPMYTKLVFFPVSDSTEDSYLNTFEIYNLPLHARMAVLSACNTGNGKLYKGEGIMSLARAFMYAGCPSVVMTLWTVNDKSSAQIMTGFYKYLHLNQSKSTALRQSKLDFIADADKVMSSPYFWGPFVTIGENRPLEKRNVEPYYIAIIAIVILLAGLFTFRLKRTKTKRTIT